MDYSLLSDSPLFKDIPAENIEAIFKSVPFRVRKYQAGLTIAQSGEPVTALIIVLKGLVKGIMVDYAGRVIKIEDIPAPGALASAFIFGKMNRYPVNVIAVADSELLFIDKSDFLKILMSDDKLLINFLNMISNRSQFLSEKIKFLNFKTIKGKLANLLLQKSDKDSNMVNLGMTQNDLADFFGVTRPSIARAIGELEKEKFIEAKGRNIRIIDKEGLAELTSE
jgi:CRP/FNR family transcriptional regulator, dissimilatory nitrate respiration regulator